MMETYRSGDITLHIVPIVPDGHQSRREAERSAIDRIICVALGDGVTIGHRQSGAPYLIGCDLNISVSHSLHYAVIALSPSGGIGVDIEDARPQLRRVAARVLSEPELAVYSATDELLLRAWTLKEALYKAALTSGLDFRRDIALPLDPEGATAFVADKPFAITTLPAPIGLISLAKAL